MQKKHTALLVDDEPELLEIMEFELSRSGFDVFKASNGQEALAQLETQRVNLIVSDIRMPILNGIELIKIVKKRYPQIPFIFITGFSDLRFEEVPQLGPDKILTKPFDLEVFSKECLEVIKKFSEKTSQ